MCVPSSHRCTPRYTTRCAYGDQDDIYLLCSYTCRHIVGAVLADAPAKAPAKAPANAPSGELASAPQSVCTFLLYLNRDTFLDEGGQLTAQLRAARAGGVPVVMLHEQDPERGGCDFSRFFETTPADLIEDGLYKDLAVALMHGDDFRSVSYVLLAIRLGATEKGKLKRTASREESSTQVPLFGRAPKRVR